MKNIHVLQTDKPSKGYILGKCIKELSDVKVGQFTRTYYLMFDEEYFQPHNIYITSDEEIKEGHWFMSLISDKPQIEKEDASFLNKDLYKKIILTTDPKLIKDGVQAIEDEFLEWFVKNPSCENVEVKKVYLSNDGQWKDVLLPSEWEVDTKVNYKIIIPKEEPKQETLEEASKDYIENTMKFSFNSLETKTQANRMLKCAEFGAKWQTKRMYNEEEVEEIVSKLMHEVHCGDIVCTEYVIDFKLSPRKWFEQFKKK